MAEDKKREFDSHGLVIAPSGEERDAIVHALEAEGHGPIVIEAGDSGRPRFPAEPPALIVVDAGAESRAWCERVRTRVRLANVPLIALTEEGGRDALNTLYAAGATAVYIKPVEPEFLRERLRVHGDTGRTLTGLQPALMSDARVLHAVPDIFLVLGADGRVREYLGGGEKDNVLRPEELAGRRVAEVLPRDVAALIGRNIKRVLSTRENCSFEFDLGEPGTARRYEMRLLPQGRDRVMAIARDVTGATGTGRAGGSSPADTLTGLPSRAAFLATLDAMVADAKLRERTIVLMSIDLEQFTKINRTLGRKVGDAVLRVTGNRLERCLRTGDRLQRSPDTGEDESENILARVGGDEFVVVLRDIDDRDDIAQVAERVRSAFVDPITYEGHKLEIRPSIGIATFPLDGNTAEELLGNARAALDEARIGGDDGCEFYSSTMKYRIQRRLDAKDELQAALADDQLELHYLPRIDLTSGRVAGLEALLRWDHPLRGTVSLGELLPLAEATGLIREIGEWVVRKACADAAEWRGTWEHLPPVSVNLSEQEFHRDDLRRVIDGSLSEAGLPAEFLELEITEAMLAREDQAAVVLQKLKAIGVGIIIDDFGIGSSSLARLIRHPIKAIKIDRSFVEQCQTDTAERSVCSAIIAMSRELGLTVIAEGVETVEQINFLRERGCDALQGFFFTEPLPSDSVPAFLHDHLGVTPDGQVVDLATIRTRFSLRSA